MEQQKFTTGGGATSRVSRAVGYAFATVIIGCASALLVGATIWIVGQLV